MKEYKGFTLIELLIASSIFTIVMVTIYSAFRTGFLSYGNVEESVNVHQAARVILEQINLDLRNSFAYRKADTGFFGEKNKLSFFTLVDNYRNNKFVWDYAFVSYSLQGNKLMRLCLINRDTLDNISGIQSEEVASNIEELVFSYGLLDADGKTLKFQDFYEDKKNLPVAVKVELRHKSRIKYDFARTIYLP